LALAAGLAAAITAMAADAPKPKAPTAADWTALAKLPDWSGVWEPDWRGEHRAVEARAGGAGAGAPRGAGPGAGSPRAGGPAAGAPRVGGPGAGGLRGGGGPKLTPEFQAKMAANPPARGGGTSGANCVPPGLPGIMTQPYPIEFLYNPGKIVIVIEAYMQFRHVYTDGRPHPEDPDPTYMGHSIGHWEGDTLVIDSVGFNDDIRIGGRYPHSDKMHIVERIRRVDKDWMQIQTTTTDPQVLAEPITTTNWYKHLDDEIREYICLENNHDSTDENGRPGFSTENQK
jgi:hypothetical protein